MVNYIEYKGGQVPYYVSYYALSRWQKETGKKIEDLSLIGDDLMVIEPLFYYAIVSGFKHIDEECWIERDDIPFILDTSLSTFLGNIGGFMPDKSASEKKPKAVASKKK